MDTRMTKEKNKSRKRLVRTQVSGERGGWGWVIRQPLHGTIYNYDEAHQKHGNDSVHVVIVVVTRLIAGNSGRAVRPAGNQVRAFVRYHVHTRTNSPYYFEPHQKVGRALLE